MANIPKILIVGDPQSVGNHYVFNVNNEGEISAQQILWNKGDIIRDAFVKVNNAIDIVEETEELIYFENAASLANNTKTKRIAILGDNSTWSNDQTTNNLSSQADGYTSIVDSAGLLWKRGLDSRYDGRFFDVTLHPAIKASSATEDNGDIKAALDDLHSSLKPGLGLLFPATEDGYYYRIDSTFNVDNRDINISGELRRVANVWNDLPMISLGNNSKILGGNFYAEPYKTQQFTASAGQTSFSISSPATATTNFSIYRTRGGVTELLSQFNDMASADGSGFVLSSPSQAGDILDVAILPATDSSSAIGVIGSAGANIDNVCVENVDVKGLFNIGIVWRYTKDFSIKNSTVSGVMNRSFYPYLGGSGASIERCVANGKLPDGYWMAGEIITQYALNHNDTITESGENEPLIDMRVKDFTVNYTLAQGINLGGDVRDCYYTDIKMKSAGKFPFLVDSTASVSPSSCVVSRMSMSDPEGLVDKFISSNAGNVTFRDVKIIGGGSGQAIFCSAGAGGRGNRLKFENIRVEGSWPATLTYIVEMLDHDHLHMELDITADKQLAIRFVSINDWKGYITNDFVGSPAAVGGLGSVNFDGVTRSNGLIEIDNSPGVGLYIYSTSDRNNLSLDIRDCGNDNVYIGAGTHRLEGFSLGSLGLNYRDAVAGTPTDASDLQIT